MSRSYAELMGLEFEAERLVRAGESRAEVSRRLGVHPQTLATWALRGGWRRKDLDLERSAEATRATLYAIRNGNRAVDRQRETRAQLHDFLRAAVAVLAEGEEGAVEQLQAQLAGLQGVARLEAPKVELGPDPKMGHMKGLGAGEIGREREPIYDEDGEVWTPEGRPQVDRKARERKGR